MVQILKILLKGSNIMLHHPIDVQYFFSLPKFNYIIYHVLIMNYYKFQNDYILIVI
jgi:hypothetical protein